MRWTGATCAASPSTITAARSGVETLAAALAEARDTLEDVVEPFLIQEGLVLRTSRGRMLGERGWRHLGLVPPPTQPAQLDLLSEPSSSRAQSPTEG